MNFFLYICSKFLLYSNFFFESNASIKKVSEGRTLRILLIIFFIASSKQLLIYNEEILVAICFFAFMIFSFRSFGDTIKDFLDERRMLIQQELQDSFVAKETHYASLLADHKKSFQTRFSLLILREQVQNSVKTLCQTSGKSFENIFSQKINQKLKGLTNAQKGFEENLQSSIALGFHDAVLEDFQRSKKQLKTKFIDQAIQSLKS